MFPKQAHSHRYNSRGRACVQKLFAYPGSGVTVVTLETEISFVYQIKQPYGKRVTCTKNIKLRQARLQVTLSTLTMLSCRHTM